MGKADRVVVRVVIVVWVVVVSRVKLGVAFAISGAFFYLLMAAVTWLLYGERLTLWQWAGIALVVTALVAVLLGPRLARPAASRAS